VPSHFEVIPTFANSTQQEDSSNLATFDSIKKSSLQMSNPRTYGTGPIKATHQGTSQFQIGPANYDEQNTSLGGTSNSVNTTPMLTK